MVDHFYHFISVAVYMTFKGKKISVAHISVFSLSIPKAINNNTGLRCGHLTNGLHLSPVKISDLKLRIAGFLKTTLLIEKHS